MLKKILIVLACALTCLAQPTRAADPPHKPVHTLKITILSTMLADSGIGEWGFAALVETDGHKILFDTGARPRTVLDNARELKVDLSDVEDVVLSHFHHDHTGGLTTLRQELMKTNPRALSRVHVGEGMFVPRRFKGNENANQMIATKADYEATGGQFIIHDKPAEIVAGVWLTGPVPRPNPEKNWQAGVEMNVDGKWIDDTLPEDQSLLFQTDKGLVLLSGCGHAGVVNTIEYARTMLGPQNVFAAVGGFHLYELSDEKLAWTAAKLKQYGVTQILGAHCTGIESLFKLRELMGLTKKTAVVATVGAHFDLDSGVETGSLAR
jgi:7,8-dihydropterin-6-yl-methyl-4-(beta-D-ribofuranosyl)aminobenzene 5'-phosphate synthase